MRLMVVKQRSGWGYETLVREVSDSLHLRRFCRIALSERVPDESTVRKLTRRLGAGGHRRDQPRGDRQGDDGARGASWRGRRGSTRRWSRPTCAIPTDSGWRPTRRRLLAREARKRRRWSAADARGCGTARGRSAQRLRKLNRTLAAAHRRGQAEQVLRLTGEAGAAASSARSARRAGWPRSCARGRAAAAPRRKLAAARRLERAGRPRRARSPRRSDQRLAGEQITDRLVSLADPDARPIRKGKLGKPTEFGYVAQLAEVTREHPPRRARPDPARRQPDRLAQRARRCCPPRPPSSTRLGPAARARSRSTAASSPTASPSTCPTARARVHRRPPVGRLAAHRPAPGRATASASRAGSATSNAATACADPASKATTARAPGRPGRSSPTTSTRSPSEAA